MINMPPQILSLMTWLSRGNSKISPFTLKSLLSQTFVSALLKSEDGDSANTAKRDGPTTTDGPTYANEQRLPDKIGKTATESKEYLEQQDERKNLDPLLQADIWNPTAAYSSFKAPRKTVVLCHGLGFFDKSLGPFPKLQLSHWGEITDKLKKLGCRVIAAKVPSTGSVAERANSLHQQLESALEPGTEVNLLAHSMGGLDSRFLLTHIKPRSYKPISLTTLSCPHHGSPFMDWCQNYLGLGRSTQAAFSAISTQNSTSITGQQNSTEAASASGIGRKSVVKPERSSKDSKPDTRKRSGLNELELLQVALMSRIKGTKSERNAESMMNHIPSLSSSIFTATMLSRMLDCPAYSNLTSTFLRDYFNPATPDVPDVQYFSFGARIPSKEKIPFWHPLFLPYKVVSEAEGPDNDGLVSVSSSTWGKLIGIIECDHWQLRGRTVINPSHAAFKTADLYCSVVSFLHTQGF